MAAFLPRPFQRRASSFAPDRAKPGAFKVESQADVRDGFYPKSRAEHLRQSRVNEADDILGDKVMTKGEHRFIFEIDSSTSSSCSNIRVGVASIDGHSAQRTLPVAARLHIHPRCVRVLLAAERWGIRPIDGRSVSCTAGRMDTAVLLASGSCERTVPKERTVRQRVEVTVNMNRRLVLYSVDGAIAIDSGVIPDDYPDALVPWVQLFYKGDSVTLSEHRYRQIVQPPSPRSPSSTRKKPQTPWSNDKPYEAGQWTP